MKKIFYIIMIAGCIAAYSVYAETDDGEDFLIQQEAYDENGGDEDFKISCGDCGSGDDERARMNIVSEEWE